MRRWALIVSLASVAAACGDDQTAAPEAVLLSDEILNMTHRGGARADTNG